MRECKCCLSAATAAEFKPESFVAIGSHLFILSEARRLCLPFVVSGVVVSSSSVHLSSISKIVNDQFQSNFCVCVISKNNSRRHVVLQTDHFLIAKVTAQLVE